MLRKLLSTGVLAIGCYAGVAQAAVTISTTYTIGSNGLPAGSNLSVVQDFNALAVGTSIGDHSSVYSTTMPGVSQRPTTATGNYAAVNSYGVGNVGSYTISLAALTSGVGTSAFGFVLGSLDPYNILSLTFSDGSTTVLQGSAITGGIIAADANTANDGFVSYTFGGAKLTSATFTLDAKNSQNAFEFDTIEAAVPEPATWGMMILGFGLVGGVLRRRQAATVRFA